MSRRYSFPVLRRTRNMIMSDPHGSLVHAVEVSSITAVCGRRPTKHRWVATTDPLTCPPCVAKMARTNKEPKP